MEFGHDVLLVPIKPGTINHRGGSTTPIPRQFVLVIGIYDVFCGQCQVLLSCVATLR